MLAVSLARLAGAANQNRAVAVISCSETLWCVNLWQMPPNRAYLLGSAALLPAAQIPQCVRATYNDLRFPADDDPLLLESLQAHGDPLPCGADHVRQGRLQYRNLRSQLMTRGDLFEQLREQGVDDVDAVKACWLESDGRLSVIKVKDDDQPSPQKRRAP